MITRTHRISKTIDAPIRFVFSWCTDFREDDGKFVGSKVTRHIVDRTKNRVMWISHVPRGKGGHDSEGIRIVSLKPYKSWHLDAVSDEYLETADYALSPLGRNRTKLNMMMRLKYKVNPSQTKDEWESETSAQWDAYKSALEKEYSSKL